MSKFIDYHPEMKLPPDALRQLADNAKSGRRDQHGVRILDVFYSPEGGLYCYLEAPSEEAVCQYHEATGVTCGEVKQVESLLDTGKTQTV